VHVYSFTSRISQVKAVFEEAYPGVEMVGYDITSTKQIARLWMEAQAGVVNADVVFISDAPVVPTELLQNGIIEAYVPAAHRGGGAGRVGAAASCVAAVDEGAHA
jgi:iron(III) transport system substrate-binding protein